MSAATPRRRFLALVRKETLQVLRDPSSLMIAVVLPVILLFIFGYGVSLDATATRIGLVSQVATPLSRDLVAAFEASRYFEVVEGRDIRELEHDLVSGAIDGLVVIPADFAAAIAAARTPTVQVIVDGTDPNTASFVEAYASGAVRTWAALRAAESGGHAAPAITVDQRVWFNAELTSRNVLVPGAIAIVMTLIGTLLTSLVVAREWERGTMEAMMATSVTSGELLFGKIVPYFLLGLASATLCLVIAVFAFGVPFRGSLLAFYALTAAFLVPALGQGLLISAATRNQFLASQAALASGFLPSFLLSGFLFEIESMPAPIRWLSTIVAARYFIPGLQSVFLAGDIWSMMVRDIAIMLVIGGVLFTAAGRSMRKRIG